MNNIKRPNVKEERPELRDISYLMNDVSDELNSPRRIFNLLILYRWLSLIPPLILVLLWLSTGEGESRWGLAFVMAIILNTRVSLFARQLNRTFRAHPWLLLFDFAAVAGLIMLTDGWRSPYCLYALSPLFVAAFFFQFQGAIVGTTFFLPFYGIGLAGAMQFNDDPPSWLAIMVAIVGFYLLSSTFGFASALVFQLRATRDDLVQSHRELQVIHDLTISLQRAADVNEVQEGLLKAVTEALAFKGAVVGLVNQDEKVISAWRGQRHLESPSTDNWPVEVPLSVDGGLVARSLLQRRIFRVADEPEEAGSWIKNHFGIKEGLIFPMLLRNHPIGVLLVDTTDEEHDLLRFQSLKSVANQAAVVIGTTMLCIDRAWRLAVQEERLRIAHEIHDTLSQSLFGMVYTLEGCLKLLPHKPQAVIPLLRRVHKVADAARVEVRQSILDLWPCELTSEQFVLDLENYAQQFCQADSLEIKVSVAGELTALSSRARRSLYRIAQEALSNIARHAGASEAQIYLEVSPTQAKLIIKDDGSGFDPKIALAREYDREHFGLRGMEQRASSLDGTCQFRSQPSVGSTVLVQIPLISKRS
jgi:signal transduction histidine kinase